METITITTAFNNSLTEGRFNSRFCLVSEGLFVSFGDKPYTPLGGRRTVRNIIDSGFVLGTSINLVDGKPCQMCKEIKQMIRNNRSGF